MDVCPWRVDLSFHRVKAGRCWDLVYDEKVRGTVPISYLLTGFIYCVEVNLDDVVVIQSVGLH